MSELERGKLYEWIITDSEDHQKKKGNLFTKSLLSKCMTEKVQIRELFWLDENGKCPALDDRAKRLGANPSELYPFTLGYKFFAKVLVTITPGKNGKRAYLFDPDSFTLSQTKEKASVTKEDMEATIRKEIEAMALTIKTRQERLDWCDKRGAAYLKTFRQMDKEGLV